MDINSYLNSKSFESLLKQFTSNIKLETEGKVKANAVAIASDAFNEGIFSIISAKSKLSSKGSLEKSNEITKLLPDNFIKSELGLQSISGIMNSIASNQNDGILNIGSEALIKRDVENFIRIVYAIGITTGFEIASDQDYKDMYLANKNRFLMHGSETTGQTKKENKTSTSKFKTSKNTKVSGN